MKKKSIAKNAMLNSLKTLMSMFFPLITFPYVSRVLQVENLGKVNFANSIISYFILLAGLGIKTYAIREGARIRDDQKKLEVFAGEIFGINILSTIASYILLLALLLLVPRLKNYSMLLVVQSFCIVGTTLGVEWIYFIKEDYLYITIRSIAIQVISMVLLFWFVHKTEDYIIYAGISTFANVAANIFNFLHVKKYIDLQLIFYSGIVKHLKPIMVIFSMTIATTIYVNSDTTMLGLICGDFYVGLYNVATKMYNILKNLMAAGILVALPRLSNTIAKGTNGEYEKEAGGIFSIFTAILLPTISGAYMISNEMIILLAGSTFVKAIPAFKILSISLAFSVFAIFFTNVVLLPMKKEKDIMYATIVSAIVNVVLNLFLLKNLAHVGAAITTLISEGVVLFLQLYSISFKLPFKINKKDFWSVLLGCLCIVLVCSIVASIEMNWLLKLGVQVVLSTLVYVCVLILFGHSLTRKIVVWMKHRHIT